MPCFNPFVYGTIACMSAASDLLYRLDATTIAPSSEDCGGRVYTRTSDECKTYCNGYAYYGNAGRYGYSCSCYNQAPAPAQYTPATSRTNCDQNDYTVQLVGSTFWNPVCYAAPTTDPVVDGFFQSSSVKACFQACSGTDGAAYIPDTTTQMFQCKCTTPRSDTSGQVACDAGEVYEFAHMNFPETSGSYRKRSRQERALSMAADKEKHKWCPKGTSPCLVTRGSEAYECIDVTQELESCGGCMYGEKGNSSASIGIDCTALPGITFGGVSCLEGVCDVLACDTGYTLTGGVCAEEVETETLN